LRRPRGGVFAVTHSTWNHGAQVGDAACAGRAEMPSGKKRKRKKINTHKRKKRLRKNRHKKKGK
jgi:hypothetical protein